ncbi:HpcH/HpaI aldolase family protein (plasmid) [Natrialba magadii ATCC 43099]|uniref:4-hydroxy-2-oxovalerate aldolase n=1 Tax=Natrialba magadii (strain ATCC 43099 / DSM 3394 / CCM 3739 / CIP 104546 / IAM 13178 / JCM 8861 / NBRC 102185 / NCIMB 2190 / MS3) TaxID=547559 RepID=D3T1K6_NATMM|nr:aldolase/citrate lyase family protein [Natrialba magadii]ADD07465.1 HpcH/HpaI aldolase family protein [Natrialba magadii ATCC 43099]ELY32183.1 4-hydroxy-2-oxovalerate aldolase [Natrialba magadii ATCC 43099]
MTDDADSADLAAQLTSENALGMWVSIGHPAIVEAAASAGFDFVLIDTEHTAMSLETVAALARAATAASDDLSVVVRPAWNDPVRIKRILDIGVDGIMVPMIDDAADARELVQATRYPPDGDRGVASGRAADYGENFVEYVESGHRSLCVIGQIETESGVENAEEIAAVNGLDALFVGPADLSASLDVFYDWDAPELEAAMTSVIETVNDAGLAVGTLSVRAADVDRAVERGFDWQIAGKDMTSLIETGRDVCAAYEESLERHGER